MNREFGLDILRGIAVIMVVCFHYLNNSYSATPHVELNLFEIFVMNLTSFGWAGVDLFFVLSGYLVTYALLNNKESVNFFQVFYVRRILRIVPIYYLFLLLYLLLNWLFYSKSLVAFEKYIPIEYYFFLIQNFIMSSLGNFGPNLLTPTWSLSVECQFYVVVPLVIYFFSDRMSILISIFFILFAVFYRMNCANWYDGYTNFLGRCDSLFLGFLFAVSKKKDNIFYRIRTQLVFTGLVVLIYLLGLKAVNHLLLAMIFLVLINVSLKYTAVSQFFGVKQLLEIGKLSYFIYLYHQLINGLFFILLGKSQNPNLSDGYSYAITLLSLCTTYYLSMISFKFIESYFIDLGQNFKYEYRK